MSTKTQTQETTASEQSITSAAQDSHVVTTSPTSKNSAKLQSDMSQSQNGNIDQVREILFGSQIRAQEESLAELESRLELEQQKLNQTFNDRLDYIEAFFKEEMHSLKQLITDEIETRSVMEKRIDNSIYQQRLEADADIKAFNVELQQSIADSTKSIESQLEQRVAARSELQNNLEKQLLTKLDQSESLLQSSLSEQKALFDDALKLAISNNTTARESLQASMQKDLNNRAGQLEKLLSTNYSELESKLEAAIDDQNSKQMEKEKLAQHLLDIAAKIQKS